MGGIWDGALAAVAGGVVGGIAGGFFGYIATLSANSKAQIANRKELKISGVETMLESVRIEAIGYWARAGQDVVTERKILQLWEALVSRVEGLKDAGFEADKIKSTSDLADQLWEISTGGDFESIHRTADALKVDQIRDISQKIRDSIKP